MKGHFYKPHCKCPKDKRCKCNATWSYIIDIGQGERKQKKKGGFKTKAEAEKAAALLIAEVEKGDYVEEKKITFKDFSKQWLELYSKSGVKVSTIRVRKHEVGRLAVFLDKLKMKDITSKKYQSVLDDLHKNLADNTLDGVHRTGRMIFKKAVELKVIKTDPTVNASLPKTQITVEDLESQTEIPKYMEKDQLALFLNTAKEKGLVRDFPMFFVLAYTGMRIGELAALKWRDIDFENQTISITKTIYNPSNNLKAYQLLTPKTKTSRRVIDVTDSVIQVLRDHKAQQEDFRSKLPDGIYYDLDFVFAQMDFKNPGYPVYLKLIGIRMARLLKLAGLSSELTPHSLRHTHTSLLAATGISLEGIMSRLGHKDDETTLHVYLHVTQERRKEAAQKFDELMRDL